MSVNIFTDLSGETNPKDRRLPKKNKLKRFFKRILLKVSLKSLMYFLKHPVFMRRLMQTFVLFISYIVLNLFINLLKYVILNDLPIWLF